MTVCHSEIEGESTFQTNEIHLAAEETGPLCQVANEETTTPVSVVNSSLNGLFTCQQHSSSDMIKSVTEDAPQNCSICSGAASCANHENCYTSVISERSNSSDSSVEDSMTNITDADPSAELDKQLQELELFSVSTYFLRFERVCPSNLPSLFFVVGIDGSLPYTMSNGSRRFLV
ncbi:uncharacterized protein CDAR_446181 [Caerostris darwini]|uniref:Uncharacterized protein n=1 Tax=Caerostris darwini TaxID=1538125 RepID=A0AAV4U8R8_9ARAC|nr:uncharacterized protein CDAR_446181 [Caerostris darwini]